MIFGDTPITPDADQARDWMLKELAKPEYHRGGENWLTSFQQWLTNFLRRATRFEFGDNAAGGWDSVILIATIALVIGVVLWVVLGPVRRAHRRSRSNSILEGDDRSSEQMRAAAEAAANLGDWHTAVLERFRALVRGVEERGIVDVVPGMTAYEFTIAAGYELPPFAADLRRSGDIFDSVRYGHLAATRDLYRWVTDTESAVRVADSHIGVAP